VAAKYQKKTKGHLAATQIAWTKVAANKIQLVATKSRCYLVENSCDFYDPSIAATLESPLFRREKYKQKNKN
jgi:hypothetical protein